MKWSWKIGEWQGIAVHVHATFLILLGFVALSHWSQGHSLAATLEGVGLILAIFGCVVLHEFGHALTAARFGIKTRDITLLPIGGVARLERIPSDPRQELWVALAGPTVNVVIAFCLFTWLELTASYTPLDQMTATGGSFAQRLLIVNVFLVLFNLLPAFPMDGGRILRAILATRMEYAKATQIAASVGQAMALLFAFAGIFGNPFLLFIAFFVWIGAAQESGMVQLKSSLGGIPVAMAMLTDFRTLAPDDSIRRAVELILDGSQHDFPVVENGRVVGVLTRTDILASLAERGRDATIASIARKDFVAVDAAEMLATAFEKTQESACPTLPVLRDGSLVGLLTMENVGEFVAIRTALANAKRSGLHDTALPRSPSHLGKES
ncbi:MAG: site-2 protease family protein [Planctomycetaceae bacterium]|nr:site-2 protease family protein [Planctomycetaceae bacterium]